MVELIKDEEDVETVFNRIETSSFVNIANHVLKIIEDLDRSRDDEQDSVRGASHAQANSGQSRLSSRKQRIEGTMRDLLTSLTCTIDPVIISSEVRPCLGKQGTEEGTRVWRVNAGVPLDFYFNPVSYLVASRWHGRDADLVERKRVISLCLKLTEECPAFAQVLALVFFREALNALSHHSSSGELLKATLQGCKLLFEQDVKQAQTTFRTLYLTLLYMVCQHGD